MPCPTIKQRRCFAAFSDSNSTGVGDISYTFRMRKSQPQSDSDHEDSARVVKARQNNHIFGFVFFRQRKDASIKRGYFQVRALLLYGPVFFFLKKIKTKQKSVVVLSSKPYMGLFREVVQLLAPAYFDMGHPILEAACETISKWYFHLIIWPELV